MADPTGFRAYLRKFVGKDVVVTVAAWKDKRSLKQNAYFWAVPVKILADDLGYEKDEMFYALLAECFGYHVGPFGAAVPNVTSSRGLTVARFNELIEWVGPWAFSKFTISIPLPGEPLADQLVREYEGE